MTALCVKISSKNPPMLYNPYLFAYLLWIVQFNQYFVFSWCDFKVMQELTYTVDMGNMPSPAIVLLHYKVFCYLHKRDLFWYWHSKCRTWHVNPVNKLRMFLLLKYYSPMNTHGKTLVCDFCVLWITLLSLFSFTRRKSSKRKFWHVYS